MELYLIHRNVNKVILLDRLLQSNQVICTTKFSLVSCPRDYHLPIKSKRAFVRSPGNCLYSCAIDVALMSECR